jgi:putative spermidine/putrescine transport system substrate-binding protein
MAKESEAKYADSKRPKSNRRDFIKTAGGAGAVSLVGLAGCASQNGGSNDSSPETSESATTTSSPMASSITVSAPGGPYKSVMEEQVYKQFEEETGISIESRTQPSTDKVIPTIRSAIEQGSAPIDILNLAMPPVLRGKNQDLWMAFETSEFSNTQYINDDLLEYNSEDQFVGIGSQAWLINLVSNVENIETPPTSWSALWDSTYENQMGLMASPTGGFLMDIAAQLHFDGKESLQSEESIREVIEKLQEVKPQAKMWFTAEAKFLSRLTSGTVPSGMLFHDISVYEKENGAPIESNFPEEGPILGSGRYVAPKSSDKRAAIKTFIDYASQPEVQDRVTKALYILPTIKAEHTTLSDDFYSRIAGPGLDQTITPSYDVYLEKQEYINQLWNELLITN